MKYLTPEIIEAAHNSDIERIRCLVAAGHSIEGTCEEGGDLLYHFIWQCCDPEMIEELLEMGCKPANIPSKSGTPLVAAVWCKCPGTVDLLLKAGADPNIPAFVGDDEYSALDTVIDDYCDCETEEATGRMIEIERMIRAAGGRVRNKAPNSGEFPDWAYQE